MAMLFIIMKQMMLLVSYFFLLWLHLFGSVVPQPWLDLEGYFVSFSFQSAAIVAAFGGKFVLGSSLVSCFLPHLAGICFGYFSVSIYCCCIWQAFCFYFFTSIPDDSLILITFYIYVRYLSIGSL